MKLIDKDIFLQGSKKTLSEIYDMLSGLGSLKIGDFSGNDTALIIVDMINGFAREGALKSPRVEAIINDIVLLSEACDKKGILKIAFADSHTDLSPEFSSYPAHCLNGTSESEIVDEIKKAGGYKLIRKNSTNGFLEQEFSDWLNKNPDISNFIITGDCTDICIQQFAITLKTWFNMKNKKSGVIVPMNAVDTYDLGMHDAELVNVMALYNMIINGVEVVKNIEMEV